jgi:tetratricopeptide (TPR) repeat protein
VAIISEGLNAMPAQKSSKPVKKTGTKPAASKSGKTLNGKGAAVSKPAVPAAPPAAKTAATDAKAESKQQLKAFERGIQLLHRRNYREAKECFERAKAGPNREVTAKAALHVAMCERRLAAPAPEPKSAEDHYNYGVALINNRSLEQARKHLLIALDMEPRGDHIHYAMGVCQWLSGDAGGAYDSLKRAIELQPRNRMVARQDSDLESMAAQPRFSRLFNPEA